MRFLNCRMLTHPVPSLQLVCTWAAAFTCPSGLSTACPAQAANISCALQQCVYNSCPLPALPDSALASVSRSCATPSLATSCSICLPSLVLYFEQAGVTQGFDVVGCIQLYAPVLIVEGASVNALQLLTQCGITVPGSISAVQCPDTLPPAQLQEIGAGCSNLNQACTTCGDAALKAFQEVGLFSPADPLVRQYLLAYSCSSKLSVQLYTAGFPVSIFFAAQGCAGNLQVPLTITASLLLAGVSTLTFSGTPVIDGLAAALGEDTQMIVLVDAFDSVGGLNVTFKVYPNNTAQQAAVLLRLASPAAASATMLAVLQNEGEPAAAAAFSLVSALGPAPTAASTGATPVAARLSRGEIAGVVVGSLVGAALGAYVVFTIGRWSSGAQASGVDKGKWSLFGSLRSTSSDTKSGSQSGTASNSSDDKAFAWSAVVSAADEVQLGELIGSGGSGRVYEALWRGSRVAVKLFDVGLRPNLLRPTNTGIMLSADLHDEAAFSWPTIPTVLTTSTASSAAEAGFVKEFAMLAQLRHPNILAVYALVREPAMVVMELSPRGSLSSYLAASVPDNQAWPACIDILRGIAAGVEFLHTQSPPIVHLDLKSDNIVLSDSLMPKIADMGLAVRVDAQLRASRVKVCRGTPGFMAPEVSRQEPVDLYEAIDVYGVGVIALDVVNSNVPGKPRVRPTLDTAIAREISDFAVTIPEEVPKPLAQLIAECMAVPPLQRPTIGVVLRKLAATRPSRRLGGAPVSAGGTTDSDRTISDAV